MEQEQNKTSTLEIIIQNEDNTLKPQNYSINELISILENVVTLSGKKTSDTISYHVEEGSVKHIFTTTALPFILSFNSILGTMNQEKHLNSIDKPKANFFENIQKMAIDKKCTIRIKTDLENTNELKIDKTTKFYQKEAILIDTDFYLYGEIVNVGGAKKQKIEIKTDEFGTLSIHTPKDFLEYYEKNLLYKTVGIHASGKEDMNTGEMEKSTLQFIELLTYDPKYDEEHLKKLQKEAKKHWADVENPEQWVRELRGSYDL